MRVEDFPRPADDNRRGIHWSASVYHPIGPALDFWIGELQAMSIRWVKLLDDGSGSSLELCQRLLAAGVMPIVRLYRLEPNPNHIGPREEETLRRLIGAGVRYFETNNEPDMPAEWKSGRLAPNWPEIVADNFIYDADRIIEMGGLPALPALASRHDVNLVEWVVQRGRADLLRSGAWIAVHNYTLNRPLDFPYDPVNQEGVPIDQEAYDRLGAWAWEGRPRDLVNEWRRSDRQPGSTLADDAFCFLAFQLIDEMATQVLGHPVPLISTEGGPVVGWKDDRRFPRVDPARHAGWVVAINEFMQGTREIHGMHCPDNYLAICHWLLGNYRLGFDWPSWESQSWYTDWWNADFGLSGELPVVAAVKSMPAGAAGRVRQAAVGGVVLRADTDEPLADLDVHLLAGGQEVGCCRTASDGTFRLEHRVPGVYDVAILPWGVVRRGVTVAVDAIQTVTIRLAGGRSSVLAGTVHSTAGVPLAGIRVTLHRTTGLSDESETGFDGAFRFTDLPLGVYRLSMPSITIAGIPLDGWQTRNLKLTAGAASSHRYAVIRRRESPAGEGQAGCRIRGTVSDATGKPIDGVRVQMTREDGPADVVIATTGRSASGAAGTFEFACEPGSFRVEVIQGDWPSAVADHLDTAALATREGQGLACEVDFRLQPVGSPGQVDGIVAGGQPGQTVHLIGEGESRETLLAADGSFIFPRLAPGSYRLDLSGAGTVAEEIVLEPGALFKAIVPMRSRLAGRALAAAEGTVAVLHAPAPRSGTRQVPLEADGSFAFHGLPAGRYRLQLDDLTLADLELTGENRLDLATIDFAQGRRSVIRGRIADGTGQPLPDVAVLLRSEGSVVAETRTAADGTYRFPGLPTAIYTLETGVTGIVASDIRLDGQREYVGDVLWPGTGPRSALQGRVWTAQGAPVPGLVIVLLRHDAEIARAQSDSGGAYRFARLPGGRYGLALSNGTLLVADIDLDEETTVTRDISLPPGPARLISHYLLFGPPPMPGAAARPDVRLALALATDYMIHRGATAGFSVAEARHAHRVTIVGDAVPASDEQTLAAAGCDVTRISGDSHALAAAFERLLAAPQEG